MSRALDYDLVLARPEDSIILANLSRDYIEKGLRWRWKPSRILALISHRDIAVLTARQGNDIYGFAAMEFHDTQAYLNLLVTHPAYRRIGIAAALLAWLLESARIAGIEEVTLEVRAKNTGAQHFYQTRGFVSGQLTPGYYDDVEDALSMNLALIPADFIANKPYD